MFGIGLYQWNKYWPNDKLNALIPLVLGGASLIGGLLMLIFNH